ncbi:LOW QUALITY PROTEIN: leucine-rich repeat-containing protein 43-like [Xiphias gladius]|uniref:LOW QUALITY PROTEIN: leucine-rich repeat-containing protein 43-like n=1 Tax=Xiphias gladius TaxID=8245 RepID=UPI001A98D53C|nr:LOW QUALITY PROTEIN: leucine-rich repeat-containing protein 43-like [Xiphias gladius]
MSSTTLSAVLEKQIRHLRLADFPCGYGSWRKTKDSTDGKETKETDALLELLSCPHSPWWLDVSWSPQAPAVRKLAVLSPECLRTDFIYNYFTTLRIMDKGVSVIDDGLLRFSKLEELVLSANRISEIPAENLPSTLKILELRANWLSALNSLTNHPPPHVQYLGLGSNSLGSHEDIFNLTGRHWPQLVSLDLSDCEFQDQQALLSALSTLPCLKTLVLEGNPFTLAPSYPGFTVDSLPQLSCLDTSWISSEERHRFRGLAELSDLIVDQASATVSVGRMTGIPDPLTSMDKNAPDFPVVNYSYFITYEFLSHHTPVNLTVYSECKSDTAHMTEDGSSDADPQSNKNCERETSKPDTGVLFVNTEEGCHVTPCVSRHSTSKLTWSECMDFSDTQRYIVSDLEGLKKFLSQGLHLRIEEEKVLSWPAASEDIPVAKPSRNVKEKKGMKGKESPIKSGSTKDKSKDRKKKSAPELVQDAPIRRCLGSVHVPLQNLVKGDHKVDILCVLGDLHTESEVEATQTLDKDLGKKIKEENEDKESKRRRGRGTGQKNTASSKGKGEGEKDRELDVHTDDSVSIHLEPVTVELSVELEKWRSASEAHHVLRLQQTS